MRSTVLVVVIALASVVSAQEPVTTVRSAVTLATLDVTVLDADGKPGPGLAARDFRIKLSGKSRPVQTLNYIEVTARPDDAASRAANLFVTGRRVVSNTTPQATQRVFVLAIDDLSFPPEGGTRLLAAARRFVSEQPSDAFIGLTTTSGRFTVNPTINHGDVSDTLSHVTGQYRDPRTSSIANAAAVGILEALEIVDHNNSAILDTVLHRECGNAGNGTGGGGLYANAVNNYNAACASDAAAVVRNIARATHETTGRQIVSISRALDAMRGARGLKQMLLLSEGIAATPGAAEVLAPIGRSAAQARAQVSVITEEAEDVDVSDSGHTINDLGAAFYTTGGSSRLRDDRAMFRAALQKVADITGGSFDLVVGAGDTAFERAVTAGSAVYRLGVEVPSDMPASKLFDLSVSVARAGVVARANRQISVDADVPNGSVKATSTDDVAGAMKAGDAHYRIPIRLAVVRRRAPEDASVDIGVGLEVPASVKGPLTMKLGLVDQKGMLKQGTRTLPVPPGNPSYLLTMPIRIDPGIYSLRVAVTDANGSVGSLETNVDASLPSMAPGGTSTLTASDLLTWWTDKSGNSQLLALDNVPAGVESLGAGLELYVGADSTLPPGLSVTMSVFAAGSDVPLLSRDATLRPGRDMTRAEVELPVAGLPDGPFVLKATVKVGGRVVGEASALLNKKNTEKAGS
jgi:hypothetical protein